MANINNLTPNGLTILPESKKKQENQSLPSDFYTSTRLLSSTQELINIIKNSTDSTKKIFQQTNENIGYIFKSLINELKSQKEFSSRGKKDFEEKDAYQLLTSFIAENKSFLSSPQYREISAQSQALNIQQNKELTQIATKNIFSAFTKEIIERNPILSFLNRYFGITETPNQLYQRVQAEQKGIIQNIEEAKQNSLQQGWRDFQASQFQPMSSISSLLGFIKNPETFQKIQNIEERLKEVETDQGAPRTLTPSETDLLKLPARYSLGFLYLGNKIKDFTALKEPTQNPSSASTGFLGTPLSALIPPHILAGIVAATLAAMGLGWLTDKLKNQREEQTKQELQAAKEGKQGVLASTQDFLGNTKSLSEVKRIQKEAGVTALSPDTDITKDSYYWASINGEPYFSPIGARGPWTKKIPTPEEIKILASRAKGQLFFREEDFRKLSKEELIRRFTSSLPQVFISGAIDSEGYLPASTTVQQAFRLHSGGRVEDVSGLQEINATLLKGEYVLSPKEAEVYLSAGKNVTESVESVTKTAPLLQELIQISKESLESLQKAPDPIIDKLDQILSVLKTSNFPLPEGSYQTIRTY